MKKIKRIVLITLISILGFFIGTIATKGNVLGAFIGLFLGWAISFFWPSIISKGSYQKRQKLISENKELKDKYIKAINHTKDLEAENQKQKQQLNQHLSVQQMKPIELDNLIKQKEEELDRLQQKQKTAQGKIKELEQEQENKQDEVDQLTTKLKLSNNIASLDSTLNNLKTSINEKHEEIQGLKDQIDSYNDQINLESYGLYTPHYSFENSLLYKEKLEEIRRHQKSMIRNNEAGTIFRQMLLDNSESKGRSMQRKNIKQLVRSFNVECEAAINKATISNMSRIEKRIQRSFEQLNKLNTPNGVELSVDYLNLKLEELHLAFEYDTKKEEEKEKLREEREKEREEKKAQAEIARKRKAVEKERAKQAQHFEQAQALLKEKMASVDKNDEKYKSLQAEVQKLKAQLADLDKQSESLDYRENHATAGYVYIISNIGSFGKNVFKIGVTRRLEPLDRIRELSSASVPFKFDVHALIFSEDAYKLETNLHNYFDKQRVNKVNNRKEFFNITIEQIKDALNKYYNRTFEFHEIPEAEEYRKSLEIAKALKNE